MYYYKQMIKALIRTAVLVGAVLLLSPVVPVLAEHEQLALVLAVGIGLIGFFIRSLFFLILVAVAIGAFFFLR